MKAMEFRRFGQGGALGVVDRERPTPGPNQLVVRVSFSSVNPVDWKLQGAFPRIFLPFRFPLVPGFDLAGEVVEVGPEVTRFQPGQGIYARLDKGVGGGSAEYAVVGEKAAALMPEGLSPREAAAIPLAGLTALQGLRDLGGLRPGHRVLITGATGGVGHFAVQIAAARGAQVTAVCSAAKAELARELGAQEVLDYNESPDYGALGPFDVIFDSVGKDPVGRLTRALADEGVLVSTLPSAGNVARAIFWPLWSKKRVRHVMVSPRGRDLDELSALVAEGKLRAVVDSVYPLEQLGEAYDHSRTGHTTGKIVIEVCPECLPA